MGRYPNASDQYAQATEGLFPDEGIVCGWRPSFHPIHAHTAVIGRKYSTHENIIN